MTRQHSTDTDKLTHAEWMAMVMDIYDVPIDLIRYESIEHDDIEARLDGRTHE